jgi:hypothetical protein
MRKPLNLLGGACAAIAVAVGAFVMSGCGSVSATVDPVAQAAGTSASAGGARVAISGRLEAGAGLQVTLSGAGAFNFAAHEGSLDLTVGGLPLPASAGPGGGAQIHEIVKGGALYLSSPLFAAILPGGARWMKVDLARVAGAAGVDPSSITSAGADPGQYLQELRAAGGAVEVVGHETVHGVATTRYATAIDLRKVAARLPSSQRELAQKAVGELIAKTGRVQLPVEAWVDSSGLVRRIAIALSGAGNGQGVGIHLQLDFLSYGATPPVSAPPASQVLDVTGTGLQGLAGATS